MQKASPIFATQGKERLTKLLKGEQLWKIQPE